MKKVVYQEIASLLQAMDNCESMNNHKWYSNHEIALEKLCENFLPSGSGFDSGTELVFEKSNQSKLVFKTAFHPLNENGYYMAWIENINVYITPSFSGFDIRVTNVRDSYLKDYITDTFVYALNKDYITDTFVYALNTEFGG